MAEYLSEQWLLEWDSADSQKCSSVLDTLRMLKGNSFHGVPNKTHGWQTIDAGSLGALIKAIYNEVFEEWLDKDDNYDRNLDFLSDVTF